MHKVIVLFVLFFIGTTAFSNASVQFSHLYTTENIAWADLNDSYAVLWLYDDARQDTVQALTNLFSRKRSGGKTRAILFSLLGGSFIGAGISSGLAGNFLLAGVCVVVVITGASQVQKYSDARLQQILTDLQNGKPVPPEVARKLKAKDFR
jgi:hypothetical protein